MIPYRIALGSIGFPKNVCCIYVSVLKLCTGTLCWTTMRKRKYVSMQSITNNTKTGELESPSQQYYTIPTTHAQQMVRKHAAQLDHPVPRCHNIVSTSQIKVVNCKDGSVLQKGIDLERLANMYPFTSYDKKRFAAITIRMANPHCTCLLFGSGKLVITGSTSYYACILASLNITKLLRDAYPLMYISVSSCVIQNIVAHVEFPAGTTIDLDGIYARFCECTTYQRSVFPGLVLRPPQSPIVLLVFSSGRIVCTGGRSYDDIYNGFAAIYKVLATHITIANAEQCLAATASGSKRKRKRQANGGSA
jgi:transcription initiation factor TFIID TATA-box-binding protein